MKKCLDLSGRRKKLPHIIRLRVKIESLRVVMEGVFVTIGGLRGQRRGFHQKNRDRSINCETRVL